MLIIGCLYYSNDPKGMGAFISSLADPKGKNRVSAKQDADWFVGIQMEQDLVKGTISLSQKAYIDALLRNNALWKCSRL